MFFELPVLHSVCMLNKLLLQLYFYVIYKSFEIYGPMNLVVVEINKN